MLCNNGRFAIFKVAVNLVGVFERRVSAVVQAASIASGIRKLRKYARVYISRALPSPGDNIYEHESIIIILSLHCLSTILSNYFLSPLISDGYG